MSAVKPQATEPAPIIIVKRIHEYAHASSHHGGAWKVAYADFATAMMAFFMLLWIVGATTEKQRRGIADYFAPTLVKASSKSSGSSGLLQGRSIKDDQGGAPASASGGKGFIANVLPRAVGTGQEKVNVNPVTSTAHMREDQVAFAKVRAIIDTKLAADPAIAELRKQVRYTETREGLRIEIIDRAGFSMFELGTDRLVPRAEQLMFSVASGVIVAPNPIAVRGHTDALRYAAGDMNNWKLSAYRAETTRAILEIAGVPEARFARIEGVADREPFIPANPVDARNRRITVTLFYRDR